MTDKYIFYEFEGEKYKVPAEKQKEFESKVPTAKMMLTFEGENYRVPISDLGHFTNKVGADKITYSAFDEKKEYLPKMSTEKYAPSFEKSAVSEPDVKTQVDTTESADSTPKGNGFLDKVVAANDSLMRSQLGSNLTYAQKEMDRVSATPEQVDTDMANIIVESHRGNKSRIDEYISEQDKTGYDYDPTKLTGSIPMPAIGLAHNMYTQSKKAQKTKGQDYTDALIAQRLQGKVGDKVEQYLNPSKTFITGAADGLKDTAFDIDTWDSGMAAEDAARVYAISKKLDKGGELTDGEQMIIDSLVDDLASDMYLAARFGRGYKAGMVTGESLPFMLETMINPASKTGEAITKKFGKTIFRKIAQKVGANAARAAVYGTRVAADIAGATIMSATTSQTRVAEDALNRLSGQVDFKVNEDGTLGFNGFVGGEDSAFKAYSKAFGANTIEHFSEMVGNYFAPIGSMTKTGAIKLADKIGAKKIANLMSEMTPNGFGSLLNDFAEQTQWHGMFGEFAEEIVSGAMNALVVGDQTMRKYDKDGNLNSNYLFDKENLIDTFLGVSILGGVMSTAKTVGYTTPETRYNREISRAKKNLEGRVTSQEMAQLEAFANNPFGASYANLTPFFDENKKKEDKEAVARYLSAIMQKQGYDIARNANLSGTQQGMEELRNAFVVGQNMTEADLYDVNEAEEKARQALADTGVFDLIDGATEPYLSTDVLDYSSYELFSLLQTRYLSKEEKEAIKNLAIVKNAKEGLQQKLNSVAQARVAYYEKIANSSANNGVITLGIHNGNKVYVKGDVQVSNGSIVKPSGVSGHPVEIVDSMTGEAMSVDSGEVSSVASVDIAQYNANMSNVINIGFQQSWDAWRNKKSVKSKLAEIEQLVGQSLYIDTGNGAMTEVEIQQILPNGEVVIKGKKGDLGGQSTIRVDVDSLYDSMTRDANGNPIFNQSKFRSQSAGIDAARNSMYVQGNKARDARKPQQSPATQPQQTSQTEATESEEQLTSEEAPVVNPEPQDFRDYAGEILINGVPVTVEVQNQDDVADIVTYTYTNENGQTRSGSTTVAGFADAVRQAEEYNAEPQVDVTDDLPSIPEGGVPVVPDVSDTTTGATEATEETTTQGENIQLAPEDIDWDALFEKNPEDFFIELQKQFGDRASGFLNMFIDAANKELEALLKKTPSGFNDIIAHDNQVASVRRRIEALTVMLERLTATEQAEVTDVAETAGATEDVAATDTESETETAETATEQETQTEQAPEATESEEDTEQDEDGLIDPNAPEIRLDNGYIMKDGRIINPTPIEMPDSPKDACRIFIAEKDGKWGYDTYVKFDNITSYGRMKGSIQKENFRYNSKEEAIKAALHYFDYIRNNHGSYRGKPHGTNGIDAFVQYVKDNYLNEESAPQTDAVPVIPVAPNPVEDPVQAAKDREKELTKLLNRRGVNKNIKKDSAFNAGKQVADMFATKEDYEAYLEVAEDLGEFLADFNRGVEASFVNRGDSSQRQNHISRELGSKENDAELGEMVVGLMRGAEVDVRLMNEEKPIDNTEVQYAKKGTSKASPASRNYAPTVGNRNPDANIDISSIRARVIAELNALLSEIKRHAKTPEVFLKRIKVAFGEKPETANNADISKYANNTVDNVSYSIRLANHASTAITFAQRNHPDNNSAVIIKMSNRRFRSHPDVKLVDYVYYPDKLDAKKQIGIVENLINWVNSGEYNDKSYDDIHSSIAKVSKMETSNGVVYGYVENGVVYLDPSLMNPNTPIHEYTHLWDNALMQLNPALWEKGKKLMKQTPIWDEVINDPYYADIKDNEDLVASEVHSRLVGTKGAERLNQLEQEARAKGLTKAAKEISILGRLREWLDEATKWLKDAFSKWTQAEIDAVTLTDFLNMPLRDLANFTKIPSEANGSPFMNAANQHIQFNIRTENTLEKQIRDFAETEEGKKAGWTEEKVDAIIKETQDLINAIHESSTGNEFYDEFATKDPTIRVDWRDGVDKPIVTWTRANIEYKYDMSADLLCINNEGLEKVLSSDKMVALMEMFIPEKKAKKGEPEIKFTADDYLELYNTLRDLGFVVPCKGCFDAAGRFKMLPSVAQKFAAEVNAIIDERNKDPKAFDEKLKAKQGEKTASGLPATASTKSAAIATGVAGDNLTEHIKWTQLMSADGQTKMLSDWGGIFRAWQRTGAGRPKDKLLPEPYYGDIVSQKTTIIGAYGDKTPSFRDILVNTGTGLRRNSHSEFRPVLAVDEIQFMREAFIRNLTVFKYMKELDDVRLFGKMGVKFNMSFFPEFVQGTKAAGLDVNGEYIASEESVGSREFSYIGEDGRKHYDGMKGFDEAKKHINKDVSLSSVIFSIPHLIKALTDVPTPSNKSGIWGSLIPFHSSGATSSSLESQGLGKARANGVGHGFDEAFTDYDKGVTNFEAVQNDRFGEGWYIVSGKKAGTDVEAGHKLEFANGTHYYNRNLGVHLFASGYILDSELPSGALKENGELNITDEQKKALMHKFTIDYNDKVRELGGPYAYKDAADYYISELPKLGLIPRFDFTVSEEKFLEMCEAANVDPHHPKLGWKGEGNSWSPIDSEAYYSVFCDYGMTDPATGEWAPHMPVGYINEKGEREFRLPDNTVEIVKEGLERFSDVRKSENEKIDNAIAEFAKRSVEKGRISQADVDKVLGSDMASEESDGILSRSGDITPEMDAEYLAAVEAGDMETAQRMVDEASDRYLNEMLLPNDEDEVGFKYHRGPAPKKIFKRYAVFNVKDGGFHAAYAGNATPTPVGVYLDAQNLASYTSDMVQFDDGTFATYIAGDTGAPTNTKFSPEKAEELGVKGGQRWLLERGGKHSSDVPNFSQMNLKVNENGEKVASAKDGALPHNKLIFEIEYGISEEGDLTDYVRENGRMMKGKNQGLAKIGPNQYYDFKTNPNAVGNWGIGGTFRITRLVPYSEVVSVTEQYKKDAIAKANRLYENGEITKKDRDARVKSAEAIQVQKWVGGYNPADFGLSEESVKAMAEAGSKMKLTDAVTYDDAGNVIPLSERFNPEKKDIRYRKTDAQNAAVDYLAGEPRLRVIERAVSEEAKKLGVQVTYKTRAEMPKGHETDKGYYNTKTGEIVICTENNADIADAIQTILHEAVAHKGLRKLMGARFNEFINRVYESLDAETKAKVDALAEKHYNGNKAVAMEEYMASLAETEDFAKSSVWDKIKDIFNNIINSILGRNDIKIGDNELRYILRASYNNMVNPRTMETIEGWAKDTNMRNELGINQADNQSPELLSRTGIDDIAFTTARDAYETVTFNGFAEILDSIHNATGFKAKMDEAMTGWRKVWNEWQMENQDDQQAVRAGLEAIQKETGNIPIEDFENYLLAENQMSSRSAEEIEIYLKKNFAPIVDQINDIITSVLKARGLKHKNKKLRIEVYKEVRQYLIAKHGLERNAYYQNEKGEMRDYSGLTALFGLAEDEYQNAEAKAKGVVDTFEALIGDNVMDSLWNKINAATKKTLKHSYESGLLSRSQYEKIRDMFKFYIPLRGFDETTAEDVYQYGHYDGNSFQPVTKQAHGRTSVAFDPISVIMNMAASEIIHGNKNRVKQKLYNFVVNRPNTLLSIRDCWYVKDLNTGAFVEAYPDFANGETWDAFEQRMLALEATGNAKMQQRGLDIGYRFQKPENKNEHYIHLRINGVERAIFVNGNPRLAEGVNGFAKKRNEKDVIAAIKKANRWASQLFTNYNYKFGGKNFFRDFIWAQTVMMIKESPMYNLRFAGNWFANNPLTIGVLMRKYAKGTLDLTNEKDVLFKEFVENGGKTGYVFIDSLDRQKHRIDKAIERMSKIGNNNTNVLTKAAVLFEIINYANECIELTARFATYATSRNTKDKNGNRRSIMQSINDAKSITTNFNRKGAQSGRGLIGGIANFMGSWNIFYNASVQGVQQVKGLNDEHPLKAKTVFGGWIALGFLMPYIIQILKDDDDDEIYWNLPEYERKNNICVPFGKGKVTMTIPLSPIIREGYAIGVTISDAMFNKGVDKDATMLSMECASLLAKALLPANPVEGLEVGLTPAENLLMFGSPDIADPIVEAVINKGWTGTPIENRTTYNEGAPHYTKVIGKDNWKERVGEKLYKSGEDNLDSSRDWNLSAWEHIFGSSAGGLGVFAKDISNIVEWVTEWKAPERLNDIPVARTFLSSNAMDDEKFVNNIYWDMHDIYKRKVKVMNKVHNLSEKKAFVDEEGNGESSLMKVYNAKAYPFLKRYYELNKELTKLQSEINEMPTGTEVEKNDKVLAEQELFNKKRDMVYELLEYEIE